MLRGNSEKCATENIFLFECEGDWHLSRKQNKKKWLVHVRL